MSCKFKDKCPSATGWCKVKEFDDSCFDFLSGVKEHLQSYIDTGLTPSEIIELKVKKVGEWIEIGASEFDDVHNCYKCSVCGKEINGYEIGYYFKFCHGCGAEMKGGTQ